MPDPRHNICLDLMLLSQRNKAIQTLLEPLINKKNAIYIHRLTDRTATNENFIWVAVANGEQPAGDYKDKKFPTAFKPAGFRLHASYYEVWQKLIVQGVEKWYLFRAYLHFYTVDARNTDFKEYLLLHCDPNDDGVHALYKQSPHIHLEFAEPPWPAAHIALNVGYLKETLSSTTSFTDVYKAAIRMLQEQVLSEIE